MRRSQHGQALVGAMVIMLILFALAGGVAVAASGLLQQGRARGAAITDLSKQSAVTDAIAQVAGSSTRCGVPTSSATFPDIDADDLTTLSLSFPDPVTLNESWNALCVRVDSVPVPIGGTPWTNLTWKSGCGTTQLPKQHVTTFFDARVGGKGGLLYVDDQPSAISCKASLPSSACSATSPQAGCVECGKTIDTDIATIVQATLDCDLSAAPSAAYYLHVVNRSSVQSPARAFVVGHASSGGGWAYLVATHLGGGSDYEESVLLVPPGGGDNQLLYKAPLP